MTGVIWMIQLVHYPLFNRVGADAFRAYEAAHASAITLLVMPLMFVELFTALALAASPPDGVPPLIVWVGLGLVGVVWVMTVLVHVPQHNRLALGFDDATYRALVATNWVRTLAWSARSILVIYMLDRFTA